jgi:hypothetical protein
MRVWGTELTGNFREKSSHIDKVAVWVAMSSQSLIGPLFLNEMVSSKRYFRMLWNDFLPQLTASGLPLQKQRLMLDAVTPHTVNVALDFFNTVFGLRVVSDRCPARHNCGNFWPLQSPTLNLCDFSLWPVLKEKLFPRKPSNEFELRGMLFELCRGTEEDLCHRVFTNMCRRCRQVTRRNGGHIEHILTQKHLRRSVIKIYEGCIV